ncbi:calcium-dependent phosphotriesterase [Auriscalpium vulgare]|uniref:Calcium-dependent phosphotriesterase n=1 Tax=Auriscalpium vulgare TaxID=40419 RepID=A0ACB8S6M4_9AGAM|nr:calcium-dependent phosphotriesterase [Auriscalpium vulgare]
MNHSWVFASLLAAAVGYATLASGHVPAGLAAGRANLLPPQAVLVDLLSSNVLGSNGTFRDSSTATFFNPTNTTPPFFQVLDPSFLTVLGPKAFVRAVTSNPDFAFAHEAPIWDPQTDEVFFASNDGGALGRSDIDHNNLVGKISLLEVAQAFQASKSDVSPVNVTVTELSLPEAIQMTNGGTGTFHGNLILINSGRGSRPPSIALVNPRSPNNATVLLDNFFGRQFNSLNDIKVHPKSGKLFFTDVTYGWLNHFRPLPLMPNQVYRFDPVTGSVRMVADGFDRPNGIAFTADGKTAYVTDTGESGGFLGNNQTEPASIYQFDVEPKTQMFTNRRVFAYVDNGVPDGIQVDMEGNVFSGCGDGVQVWNNEGTLIGKVFLGTTSANLVFASKGRLVIMAETSIYFAQTATEGQDLASLG